MERERWIEIVVIVLGVVLFIASPDLYFVDPRRLSAVQAMERMTGAFSLTRPFLTPFGKLASTLLGRSPSCGEVHAWGLKFAGIGIVLLLLEATILPRWLRRRKKE